MFESRGDKGAPVELDYLVAAHELAHLVLNLDDTYVISESITTSPGRFSLMEILESGHSPRLHGIDKLSLGWVDVRTVDTDAVVSLEDVKTKAEVLVLPRDRGMRTIDEYYQLENRQDAPDNSLYDKAIFGSGIALWHAVADNTENAKPPPCESLWGVTGKGNWLRNLRKNVGRREGGWAMEHRMDTPSQTVNVDLGERSYPIHIGGGQLAGLGNACVENGLSGTGLVITDSNVGPLYGNTVLDALRDAGLKVSLEQIPAGEPSKNLRLMADMYERAIAAGVDRRGFVVALGGGVVGDLSGFVAASLFRGVKFVQVPTSLLAMVDSAVGGKTGVNLKSGKNLVGAFHQPELVLADTDVLKTLPPEELVAGMAEVVKYGVIYDADLFAFLEDKLDDILALEPAIIAHIVRRSCEIKADVVRQDEREGGLRAILNYGHTLGHAVEKVTAYQKYLHGQAIGIGMAYAAHLSAAQHGLSADGVQRQLELMTRLGLPTQDASLDFAALRTAMSVDKKSVASVPKFVLASRIGSVDFGIEVPDEAIEHAWHVQHREQVTT